MATWEIEYTDEFEAWWRSLSEEEQVEISAKVAPTARRRNH
jgi:hypothetical protein